MKELVGDVVGESLLLWVKELVLDGYPHGTAALATIAKIMITTPLLRTNDDTERIIECCYSITLHFRHNEQK